MFLRFLNGVPECCPVFIFFGGLRREKDFRINYAALPCVIGIGAVILVVQFFPGAVGRCRDYRLSFGTANQVGVEMVERH